MMAEVVTATFRDIKMLKKARETKKKAAVVVMSVQSTSALKGRTLLKKALKNIRKNINNEYSIVIRGTIYVLEAEIYLHDFIVLQPDSSC